MQEIEDLRNLIVNGILKALIISAILIYSLTLIRVMKFGFNPFFYMIDGFRYGFFGKSAIDPWISFGVVATALAIVSTIAVHLLRIGYKIRS